MIAAFCLASLAACSTIPVGRPWDKAFFTAPPPRASIPGGGAPHMVSVCYSRLSTSLAELRRMVAAACVDPRYLHTDYIGGCTLTAPARVTFACSRINPKAIVIKKPYTVF